ncbi:MAG TPA: cysteine synthase A [Terriglobales bacterium]|nr:cysteine synthase A [Terriglobales bacterium]
MSQPKENILDCIGHTPMLTLELEHQGRSCRISAKAEFLNPSGSVKDRIARYMLDQAEQRGQLRSGSTIIELSSGNTGIALAQAAAVKGYRLVILMPEHMSAERVRLLQSLGAEVCLTPQADGFAGALARLNRILEENPQFFCPRQFENSDNPAAHYRSTGPEIWQQMAGRVDAFIDGVGTGGTLMGVGRYLREHNPKVALIAVEPAEAAVMSGGGTGAHKIAGIGDGFIPPIMDMSFIDGVEAIASDEAVAMAKRLSRQFGLFVGISSGANILAAIRTLDRLGHDCNVVTILPDRSERYFSTDLYLAGEWPPLRRCAEDCICRLDCRSDPHSLKPVPAVP